jgi:hypothetical protein
VTPYTVEVDPNTEALELVLERDPISGTLEREPRFLIARVVKVDGRWYVTHSHSVAVRVRAEVRDQDLDLRDRGQADMWGDGFARWTELLMSVARFIADDPDDMRNMFSAIGNAHHLMNTQVQS